MLYIVWGFGQGVRGNTRAVEVEVPKVRTLGCFEEVAGCGMCAVPIKDLRREQLSLKKLQRMQSLIKEYIPTGALPFSEARRPQVQTFSRARIRAFSKI